MTLEEIRQKYPQYADLSDQVLADSLYESSYSDIERPEFDSLVGFQAKPDAPNASIIDTALDYGIDFSSGAVSLGESVVGIGDLLTGNLVGKGLSAIGYDPEKTREMLKSGYSPERKQQLEEVQAAEGFLNTVTAAIQNPGVAIGTIIESTPYLLGSAALVRSAGTSMLAKAGITAGTPAAATFLKAPEVLRRLATIGAVSEGAMAAGSIQEQARQAGQGYTDSAGYAVAAGAGTALIGRLASRIPGFGDLETTVGTAGLGAGEGFTTGRLKQAILDIGKGAIQEGVLEELPQSAQEQVFSNLALDKPWNENVPEAAAMGLIAGAGMGGGVGIIRTAMRRKDIEETIAGITDPDKSIDDAISEADQILQGNEVEFNAAIESSAIESQAKERSDIIKDIENRIAETDNKIEVASGDRNQEAINLATAERQGLRSELSTMIGMDFDTTFEPTVGNMEATLRPGEQIPGIDLVRQALGLELETDQQSQARLDGTLGNVDFAPSANTDLSIAPRETADNAGGIDFQRPEITTSRLEPSANIQANPIESVDFKTTDLAIETNDQANSRLSANNTTVDFQPTKTANMELAPKAAPTTGSIDFVRPETTTSQLDGAETQRPGSQIPSVDFERPTALSTTDAPASTITQGESTPAATTSAPDVDYNPDRLPLVKSDGTAFKTEKSASMSKQFKSVPGATVIPVDGGFAVKPPTAEQVQATRAQAAEVDKASTELSTKIRGIVGQSAKLSDARTAIARELGDDVTQEQEQNIKAYWNQNQQKARKQIKESDSLAVAIAKLGGIDMSYREDMTRDTTENKMVPGVGAMFNKKGTSPDDMATALLQYNYLTQSEIDNAMDNGGVNALTDLINEELSGGKKRYQVGSAFETQQMNAEMDAEYLEQQQRYEEEKDDVYSEIAAEYGQEIADQARAYDQDVEDYVYTLESDLDSQMESQIQQERDLENETINQDAAEANTTTSDESIGQVADQQSGFARTEDQNAQEQDFQLGQQSDADILAQERAQKAADDTAKKAEDKQKADDELGDFTLAGSNSAVDQAESRGQGNMFDAMGRAPASNTEAEVKRLTKQINKGEGTDQLRAKAGGEFGPNGEWYEGGKFIATTNLPKRMQVWLKNATRNTEVLTEFATDDTPAKKSIPRIGQFPIVAGIADAYGAFGPQGKTSDGREEWMREKYSPDLYAEIVKARDLYISGDRWVSVLDFPLSANVSDLARMIVNDIAVPEEAIINRDQKVQDNIRAVQKAYENEFSDIATTPAETSSAELVDDLDIAEKTAADIAGEPQDRATLITLRNILEDGTDSMNGGWIDNDGTPIAIGLMDSIDTALESDGDLASVQQDAEAAITELLSNGNLDGNDGAFISIQNSIREQLRLKAPTENTSTIEQANDPASQAISQFTAAIKDLTDQLKAPAATDQATQTVAEPAAEETKSIESLGPVSLGKFETGKPVTFNYVHNPESATKLFGIPNKDSDYNRGYEPSGRYINESTTSPESRLSSLEYDEITFENPLVIDNADLAWKEKLSDYYGGQTGKELSKAVIADGYDAVITVEVRNGSPRNASEIVDLTTFDEDIALFSQMDEQEISLVALHNLSAENLVFSDKMGGIAVPSMAITNSQYPHSGFGDITLIGTKELGDPARNEIYDADAYTTRYPKAEYNKVGFKKADKLVNEIRPFVTKYEGGRTYVIDATFDYAVNNPDPEKIANEWIRSNGIKAMYLIETTGVTPNIPMKDQSVRYSYSNNPVIIEFFDGLTETQKQNSSGDTELRKSIKPAFEQAVREKAANRYGNLSDRDITKGKFIEIQVEMAVEEFFNEDGEMFFARFENLVNDNRKVGKQEIDKRKLEERLDKKLKGKESEFQDWTMDKILSVFSDPFVKVGREKLSYNVYNIAAAMTSKATKGNEKTMTFGEGMARAMASEKMTSTQEMKNRAKWQLASEDVVSEARDKAKELLSAYRESVVDYYNVKRWDGGVDTWAGLDAAMQVMAGSSSNRSGMKAALRKNGFVGVPNDLVDQAVEAREAMMDAPVPYFEAKPERVVRLEEFAGAVVPSKTDKKVIDILEKNGIKVTKYDSRNEGARNTAVVKASKSLDRQRKDILFNDDEILQISKLQATPDVKGVKVEKIRESLAPVLANLNQIDGFDVEILQSVGDLPPGALNQTDKNGRYKGAFYQGKVYLFADNLNSRRDAETTLAHELVGHKGVLVGATAEEWSGIKKDINNLLKLKNATAVDIASETNRRYKNLKQGSENWNKEFLAIAAERRSLRGTLKDIVEQVKAIVRRYMKELGFKGPFAESDIESILQNSEQNLRNRRGDPRANPNNSLSGVIDLPMDTESRLKRARDMGFDTSTIYYHGTTKDFDEFNTNQFGEVSGWFTTDPEEANAYAFRDGSRIVEVFLKTKDAKIGTANEIAKASDNVPFRSNEEKAKWKQDNFDFVKKRDGVLVPTKPSNIRSVNAAFDPNQSDSSDLLSSQEQSEYDEAVAKGLDMSKSARMKRAIKMGFDVRTTWYHGTDKAFRSFDATLGQGSRKGTGVFVSLNPSTASSYSGGYDPQVIPLMLRLENSIKVYSDNNYWNKLSPEIRVELPERVVNQSEDVILLEQLGLPAGEETRTEPMGTYTLKELFPGFFNLTDNTMTTNDFTRWAKEQGVDGVIFEDIIDRGPSASFAGEEALNPSTNAVIFDPANIRSVNAAFDPANTAGSDLLSSQEQSEYDQAVAKGLDMSKSERMSRAEDMGFDTDTVYYHGTSKDFDEFSDNSRGIFFTTDSSTASTFSRIREGEPRILPVYLSVKNPWTMIEYGENVPYTQQENQTKEALIERGYDGIIVPKTATAPESMVAFNPSQIRSVNAAFDPDSSDSSNILMSQEEPDSALKEIADRVLAKTNRGSIANTLKQSIEDHKDNWQSTMRRGLVDEYQSIADLEIAQYGELRDATDSAYKAATLSKKSGTVLDSVMTYGAPVYKDGGIEIDESMPGLVKIFEPLAMRGMVREWELWAGAVRAKRLMAEGRENLYTQKDIDTILGSVTGKKLELYQKIQRNWTAFNKRMLDFSEAAGLINPEERQLWESDDYVPFHRISELPTDNPKNKSGNTKGLAGKKSGITQLKGGVEQISIMESIVRNTTSMIDASMKNIAMQRTIEMAEKTGVVEEVSDATISDEEAIKRLDDYGIQYTEKNLGAYKSLLAKNDARNGTVSVSVNGKPKRYLVNDPVLLRAMNGLGPTGIEGVMKIFRMPKMLLTELIVADPSFSLRNFTRDTLSTWVTVNGIKRNPISDAVKNVRNAYNETDTLKSMRIQGVGGGSFYDVTPEGVRSHLEKVSGDASVGTSVAEFWQSYKKVLGTTELANRMAVYDAVIKAGGSKAEAAYQADDVLNFTRHGEWKAINFLIQSVPFMNSRIQGLDRLARGAKEGTTKAHQFNQQFMMKGAVYTAATLALLAANWDNEDYWDLEEWERDTYYHFYTPGGGHFRMPKPFEVGAIFSTVPERLFEQFREDANMKLLGKRMLSMFANTFAFDPVPQIFKPAYEVAKNESSFTKRQILSQGMKYASPEAQYTPYTSKTFIELADAMPDSAPEWMRSPARLEHLYRGYLGTLGGYVLLGSDFIARQATGAPPRPEARIRDIPVLNSFIRDGVQSNKQLGKIYDLSNDINEIYTAMNKYRKEGASEKAISLLTNNKEKLRLRIALNKTTTQMGNIGAQIRKVYDSDNLNAAEKRKMIDDLTTRRNAIAKNAERRFRDFF